MLYIMKLVALLIHGLWIGRWRTRRGSDPRAMTRISVVVSVKEPDSIFHYSCATLGDVQIVPIGEQAMIVDYLEHSL